MDMLKKAIDFYAIFHPQKAQKAKLELDELVICATPTVKALRGEVEQLKKEIARLQGVLETAGVA